MSCVEPRTVRVDAQIDLGITQVRRHLHTRDTHDPLDTGIGQRLYRFHHGLHDKPRDLFLSSAGNILFSGQTSSPLLIQGPSDLDDLVEFEHIIDLDIVEAR